MSVIEAVRRPIGQEIMAELCNLNWRDLTEHDVICVAWAYYFFSVQFRENLEIAFEIFGGDADIARLVAEECATDNLSPFDGVAEPGEALDHDEFMRRTLELSIDPDNIREIKVAGNHYLETVRSMTPMARALSIGSYEAGGLENLFKGMLTAPQYNNPLLAGFRYFMEAHIQFDSDPLQGHGALSRVMTPDETVVPLWAAFEQLLHACVPGLVRNECVG